MARQVKQAPSLDVFYIPRSDPLLEATIHVVTPMFGGGFEAGEVDGELPISVRSVRGHLRFWWRACNAHRFGTKEELFAAEAEIWGQAARKSVSHADSQVDVLIEDLNTGEQTPGEYGLNKQRWNNDNDPEKGNGYPSYALWPFRGKEEKKVLKTCPKAGRVGDSFRLVIRENPYANLPANVLKEAVNSAVWAWIMFGGVGARTRRGCGALWTDHQPMRLNASSADDALNKLSKAANDHISRVDNHNSPPLPMLLGSQVAFLSDGPTDVLEAWRKAVNQMRDFRQGAGVGRVGQYGHSYWPEANSIRDERSIRALEPSYPTARPFYPRAELGLPIVFHFKDNEMDDHTLQSSSPGASRMASPFVLKPLAVSPKRAFPLVLMMQAPLVSTLQNDPKCIKIELMHEDASRQALSDEISSDDINDPVKAKAVKPLKSYGGGNARTAFFNFVKSNSNTSGSLT